MIQPELLDSLATKIASRITPARALRVGIDGRCGSGKTTLANQLAEVLRLRGVHADRRAGDDYHNPPEIRYRQGELSARGYYEDAFDHAAMRKAVAEAARPGSVLLFEGMFLFRTRADRLLGLPHPDRRRRRRPASAGRSTATPACSARAI